jgi:hypothetical protein
MFNTVLCIATVNASLFGGIPRDLPPRNDRVNEIIDLRGCAYDVIGSVCYFYLHKVSYGNGNYGH